MSPERCWALSRPIIVTQRNGKIWERTDVLGNSHQRTPGSTDCIADASPMADPSLAGSSGEHRHTHHLPSSLLLQPPPPQSQQSRRAGSKLSLFQWSIKPIIRLQGKAIHHSISLQQPAATCSRCTSHSRMPLNTKLPLHLEL